MGGPGRRLFSFFTAFDKVVVDGAVNGVATFVRESSTELRKTQSGFVRNYAHDAVDRAAVHSIAQVGLALGIEVVAEGVESEADIPGLRDAGVGQVQGFSLHRPCPLQDLIAPQPLLAVTG